MTAARGCAASPRHHFTPIMQGFVAWNVNLTRVAGVQVRLHWLFVAFGAFAALAALENVATAAWWGLFFAVLAASVVVHEAAHCLAARRHGGAPHELVLWPLGGLVQVSAPRSPGSEIAIALAGPLANFGIAVVCTGSLFFWRGELPNGASWWPNLAVPPRDIAGMSPLVALQLGALQLGAWLNLWLAVVNLVPAVPLDGGRAMRGFLWALVGFRRAKARARAVTMASAASLCLLPVLLRARGVSLDPLVELPLSLLGVLIFLTARGPAARGPSPESEGESASHEPWRDTSPAILLTNEDLPLGPGVIGQAVEARRDEKLHQQQQEEEEDRRVDEILSRLHVSGADALSPEDQRLLERVSARYRGRKSK